MERTFVLHMGRSTRPHIDITHTAAEFLYKHTHTCEEKVTVKGSGTHTVFRWQFAVLLFIWQRFFLKFRCQVSQLSSCFPSPHPLSSQVPVSLKKGSSWLLSNVNCFASHPGTAPWACSTTLSLQQSQRPQPCYIPLPPDWGRDHIWLNRVWKRKSATTTCIPVDHLELEGLQKQIPPEKIQWSPVALTALQTTEGQDSVPSYVRPREWTYESFLKSFKVWFSRSTSRSVWGW